MAAAILMMTRDSFGPTSGLLDSGRTALDCLGHSDRTWQLFSEMGIEWPGEGDYRCTGLLFCQCTRKIGSIIREAIVLTF